MSTSDLKKFELFVSNELQQVGDKDLVSVEDKWTNIKKAIHGAVQLLMKEPSQWRKKEWITDDTLVYVEKKRMLHVQRLNHCSTNVEEQYRLARREVKKKIRQDKKIMDNEPNRGDGVGNKKQRLWEII